MSHPKWKWLGGKRRTRRAMTLVELIIATTITSLIVAGMAALAMTVESGGSHGRGLATALQHAEVVVERMERTMSKAFANGHFPGFVVLADTEAGVRFPDTLVVWSPIGAPFDANGLPRLNEIVVYSPNPANPRELLEMTARESTVVAPAANDLAGWQRVLMSMRSGAFSPNVVLTDRIRVAGAAADSGTSQAIQPVAIKSRAAVRFDVRLSPSDAELGDHPQIDWNDLPWVQDIHNPDSGLRQAWCRFEIQLTTNDGRESDPDGQFALPFFGSSALYYQVRK